MALPYATGTAEHRTRSVHPELGFEDLDLSGATSYVSQRRVQQGKRQTILVDLDLLVAAGEMESPNANLGITGWDGSGNDGVGWLAVTNDQSKRYAGRGGLKVLTADNEAGFVDIEVRAGERLTIAASLLGDGTNAAKLLIENLETGLWLSSAAAWQAARTACLSRTAATWDRSELAFTVEAIQTVGKPLATLRLWLAGDGSTVYFDDVTLVPQANLLSLHGHTLRGGSTIKVVGYTRRLPEGIPMSGFGSDATLTLAQPSCYAAPTATAWRYVRLIATSGRDAEAPVLGELVVARTETLAQRPMTARTTAWVREHQQAQVRMISLGGDIYATLAQDEDRRVLRVPWVFFTAAGYSDFARLIRDRARGGTQPVLLVPTDAEAMIILGLPDPAWSDSRMIDDVDVWGGQELALTELPGPVSGL